MVLRRPLLPATKLSPARAPRRQGRPVTWAPLAPPMAFQYEVVRSTIVCEIVLFLLLEVPIPQH